MKTSLSYALCLLTAPVFALAVASTAHAADKDMMMSKMDKTFVQKAAMGGLFEVESGKVAADKGDGKGVKEFGSKMVEDHGKANEELKSIVTAKGMEVPMGLDSMHQKMVDSLNAKSGKDFDKAYMMDMAKAHKMDDALFIKEAKSGKDADLKAFASKTDVVIKKHISMLNDTMKM